MEKNIIHHLLFFSNDLEEQIESVKKLQMVPKEFYEKETLDLIKAIEFSHKMNRPASINSISTFLKFNKSVLDIDDYFYDVEEEDSRNMVVKDACEIFVKQKEKEINKILIERALAEYEKTGNVNLLKGIDFSTAENTHTIKTSKEMVSLGLEKLRKIKNKQDDISIKFSNSFFYIQMITKGLEPGELIVLAARPGVGKTAFTLALLNDFSKQNKKCLYISLEMSSEEISERMLTAKTGIPRSVFFSQNDFTDEKFEELEKAADQISNQSFKVLDDCPNNFVEIREKIREEHRKNGLDICFIDYLGLIGSYAEGDNLNVRDTVSKISRSTKLLAKELKIPIILIQQVNRNAALGHREDSSYKELQLTDLRDSGQLEQDANKVFLLWNQEPKTDEEKQDEINSKYKVIFDIAKNRNGQNNQKILYKFDKTLQRIKELDWITKPSTWRSKNE